MKKFLAVALAIALVITGLYPMQWVKAATTKQNDGLNFQNSSPWLYSGMEGYYKAEKVHDSIPTGFEATIRIPVKEGVFGGDDRVIFSNGALGGTTAGTVEFGVTKDTYLPKLAVVDTNGTRTEYVIPSNNSTTLQTGEWLHLAITAQNGTISAYVNGELFGSVNGTIPTMTPAKAFCIAGDYSWTNTSTFMGDIKNVAVWNNLTASAVATHAANGGVVSAGATGLISAYNLNLEANGTYPDKLIDVNGKVDFVSTTAKFITEEEAVALSGRPDNYDFSMVVIGDQQVPTAYQAQDAVRVAGGGRNWYPDQRVDKVFQWVVDNVESKKIKFAFNMGDIVDNYGKNSEAQNSQEWIEGAAALKSLNGNVPYSIVRGNHDADAEFNQFFPLNEMKNNMGTELVSFDGTTMNTTYQKFTAGGIKYLLINLDFGVAAANTNAEEILAWANDVVATNLDYNVIVATHGYLGADGVRLNTATHGNGGMTNEYYSRAKSGEDIWNEFVKLHENIVMVLSGHVGSDGLIKKEATGINGNKIIELCVNAQDLDVEMQAAGNYLAGNVAMLYFSEGGTKVTVENYSTLRDQYYNPANQFTMTLNRIGEGQTYDLDNGAIAVPYNMVDTTGDVPAYGDYLFAGWYKTPGCTLSAAITNSNKVTDTCYAKFIPADVLTVKAQVSTSTLSSGEQAGNWAMRFVSSVEGVNYKNVGFKVTNGSEVLTSSEANVYSKIASTEAENAYTFSPGVISKYSEYFFTAKLAVADTDAAKATDYTVQAFVETFDGTIVYGPKRVVCVNDGLNGTSLNMVIKADLNGSGYTADYLTGNYGNESKTAGAIEILPSDAGYTNIRVPLKVADLFSATKIIIKDASGTEVASGIYRNYYTTSHRGWDTPNADYSWYYLQENSSEYVLGSSADLYGFNTFIGWGDMFQGKTIRLVRDIEVNKGTAVRGTASSAPSWQPADGAKTYEWTSKCGNWGDSSNCFNGTFDGGGNTISGIVITQDTSGAIGLFGSVAKDAVIKNLGLTNSYIKASADFVGSIVGYSYAAKLENLYSDAVVHSTYSPGTWAYQSLGGIVGHMDTPSAGNTHVVSGAWFDGQIYYAGNGQGIGGIAGKVYDANGSTFKLYDCLFSGDIYATNTSSYRDYAGILPQTVGGPILHMANCLNVGTIKGSGSWGCGAALQASVGGTIKNCYAVESDVYTGAFYNTGTNIVLGDQGEVSLDSLKFATQSELLAKFPILSEQSESAWMCNTFGDTVGTPILKAWVNVYLQK